MSQMKFIKVDSTLHPQNINASHKETSHFVNNSKAQTKKSQEGPIQKLTFFKNLLTSHYWYPVKITPNCYISCIVGIFLIS